MRVDKSQYLEDAELFAQIQKGSEAAFYELFHRYWEMLYAIAKGILRDGPMAEDLVQEVFADVWERRESIINNNVKAYLSQSVRFQVFKQLRKTNLSDVHVEALEIISSTGEADDLVNYKELQQQVENALQSLPNRCREIFQLSRYEQLSNKEIAQRLNISVRTVETQISIALKYLRGSLMYVMLMYIGSGRL